MRGQEDRGSTGDGGQEGVNGRRDGTGRGGRREEERKVERYLDSDDREGKPGFADGLKKDGRTR